MCVCMYVYVCVHACVFKERILIEKFIAQLSPFSVSNMYSCLMLAPCLQLLTTYEWSHFRGKRNIATTFTLRSCFLSCQAFKWHGRSKAHHSHHDTIASLPNLRGNSKVIS